MVLFSTSVIYRSRIAGRRHSTPHEARATVLVTFFFWLWFEDLPITTKELYRRLKQRGVLVVPGQYFFPGLDEAWRHKDECIRLNYSQDDGDLERGIVILGEELERARAAS